MKRAKRNISHRKANLLQALVVFLVDRWAARPGGFHIWKAWVLWGVLDEMDRRED